MEQATQDSPPPTATTPAERLRRLASRAPDLLVVLVASVAFGLSFGLNYGVDNQTAYMLSSLRLLDPSVLANDWYASGPAGFHPTFAYLGWFLLSLDRGGFYVGALLVTVVTLGALCFYWLASVLWERRVALASFLLLLALLFVTRTKSVAVSYAFDFILQASTLGSLFLVAALPPFVAGRWMLCGVMLALSGLFHANYLVLGIATFGFAHLVIGWKDLPRRLLHQFALPVAAALLLAPLILRSVSSPDAAAAQDILFNVRSPHHYVPKNFRNNFFSLAAWQMLGIGAGAWLLREGADKGKRLGALLLAFAVLLWTGTALTTWVWIPRFAQIFVWRFAPYHNIMLGLLFCGAVVHVATRPSLARKLSPTSLALALGGLVSIGMLSNGGDDDERTSSMAGALLLTLVPAALGLATLGVGKLGERFGAAFTGARAWLTRHGAWLVVALAAALCFVIGRPYVTSYRTRSNVLNPATGAEHELYDWVRANTDKGAVFLTPPSLDKFRLWAERAIVIDWKGCPIVPSDIMEWYHRLEDVSGRKGFRKRGDVNDGYNALDAGRLAALRTKYGLSYVVVSRGKEKGLPGKPVYRNGRFVVLQLE